MYTNHFKKSDEAHIAVHDITVKEGRVSFGSLIESVEMRKYFPEIIDTGNIRVVKDNTGEVTIEKVAFGGGSSIILELPNRIQYLASVIRDSGAPGYPNSIDTPTGILLDLIPDAVKEGTEEIIILDGDSAVIPQFQKAQVLSKYNEHIRNNIQDLLDASDWGIARVREVEVDVAELKEPLHAVEEDANVALGFEGWRFAF